ncbi:MAG: tetratricopeptide repeat protein [Candidatus Hermodarchaeota archaeon]
MSDPRPEQLIRAEELMYNGKVKDALEVVVNFEKKVELTPKDQLWSLLLKGNIYRLTAQLKEAVEVGELAYSMSQELGLVPESIEALFLMAVMVYLGKPDEAIDLISKAEELFNSLSNGSPANITKLKFLLTYIKSRIYLQKNNINTALDLALEALTLGEKIKYDVQVGYNLDLFAVIYLHKGELDTALEYAIKSLKLFEKLDFQTGIAQILFTIGLIYFSKGDLNRALDLCKKSLSIEKISDYIKASSTRTLGQIYQSKGELNKALKYIKQSTKFAEENLNYFTLSFNKRLIGEICREEGENDQAIEYFKQALALSEKIGSPIAMIYPLLALLLINLDNNSRKQAQEYLKRLENLSDQHESILIEQGCLLGKASILKNSGRMRDHTDAERLLKQIVEQDIFYPQFHILSIVSLCDLLLEELSIYNNPEVLDEISPLIMQLLKIAENQHSFSWLGEAKLLQAKLALIQMSIEEAKKVLTEAQQVAEEQGLNLLAQKISNEHDILLEKTDEWDKLKNENAPMANRIELASFDGIIDRLQGKQAIDPPELVEEEPILLLIMSEGGITYFNHLFVSNWDHNDLFSSFLSAFNTFSDQFFSKSIDRIRIGEFTILINPVLPFLACYVIKGQSYPALQKLTRFTESIKENTEIWEALKKAAKTSEMLELNKPPALRTVINEIFTYAS